jgi:hypothetical protein
MFMRGAYERDAIPSVTGDGLNTKAKNPKDFLRSIAALIGECDAPERAQHTEAIERRTVPHGQDMHADGSHTQSPPASQNAALRHAPAAHQVDDQHDECKHQQQVNQSAGDVKAKTKKPQNQKHNKNCPKHVDLLRSLKRFENLSTLPYLPEQTNCCTRSKSLRPFCIAGTLTMTCQGSLFCARLLTPAQKLTTAIARPFFLASTVSRCVSLAHRQALTEYAMACELHL